MAMVISWFVPLLLILMLAASIAVYWVLDRRWTVQGRWVDLADWATDNGMKLCRRDAIVPPAISRLLGHTAPRALMSLVSENTTIIQIEAAAPPPSPLGRVLRWNLLVRHMAFAWPTSALRPVSRPASIPDYLALGRMYGTLPGERFAAYGDDRAATLALADSAARGLLPQDIALVLVGQDLILDFSTRPLDSLTLHRIDALASQLLLHLPPAPVAPRR